MTHGAGSQRATTLGRLATESFDLLVVGGGITGVGTALDAASRGLRTALVERDDIAAGTSSRSSKLIHGGLRYLEQLQFGLVRQGLAERRRLLRLAPHLVRIEPFLVPVYGSRLRFGYMAAGLTLYDALGARHDGGWTRFLTPATVRDRFPAISSRGLAGGLVYHDGVEDDARLAIAVARTAVREGAAVATLVQAIEPVLRSGRVVAARVREALTDTTFDIATRAIVDATGAVGDFGAVADSAADDDRDARTARLAPSRGSHFVIHRDRIPLEHGLTIRVPGRVVFVIPSGDFWIVGTTDVPHEGPTDHPSAGAEEIRYLLDSLAAVLDVPVDPADIVATYAGIRPLVARGRSRSTVQVSREHLVDRRSDGVVRIRGGKYTTYRVMARDAVDLVLGDRARTRPSTTGDLPLVGALAATDRASTAADLGHASGLAGDAVDHLLSRHGSEAPAVVRLGQELDLLRPLVDTHRYLEAEVAWAAREELATSVDDVLARRTRLAIESRDHGAAAAPRVAAILAAELRWDASQVVAATERYAATGTREYAVPGLVSMPARSVAMPMAEPAR